MTILTLGDTGAGPSAASTQAVSAGSSRSVIFANNIDSTVTVDFTLSADINSLTLGDIAATSAGVVYRLKMGANEYFKGISDADSDYTINFAINSIQTTHRTIAHSGHTFHVGTAANNAQFDFDADGMGDHTGTGNSQNQSIPALSSHTYIVVNDSPSAIVFNVDKGSGDQVSAVFTVDEVEVAADFGTGGDEESLYAVSYTHLTLPTIYSV